MMLYIHFLWFVKSFSKKSFSPELLAQILNPTLTFQIVRWTRLNINLKKINKLPAPGSLKHFVSVICDGLVEIFIKQGLCVPHKSLTGFV